MKPAVTFLSALLLFGGAQASDVYKTVDANGRPVYTDRPGNQSAERLNIRSMSTDPAEVQRRYDDAMKRFEEADKAATDAAQDEAEAREIKKATAADRARRCQESRDNYAALIRARRIYEPGPGEGERRYLDDDEITAARENAKQLVDEFCD